MESALKARPLMRKKLAFRFFCSFHSFAIQEEQQQKVTLMIQWMIKFQEARPQTKYFILTWFVFGLALVLSTLFVYGRLDYVRSDKALQQNQYTTSPPKKT